MIAMHFRDVTLAICVVGSAIAVSANAADQTRVPPQVLANALITGKTWKWSVPDGKHGDLTFNPDGTALLRGPITKTIKWRVADDAFCLSMGLILGTKCLTATAVASGFQTYEKGRPAFLFVR